MGYVYLIGSSTFGWYKIGKTRNPKVRIRELGILLPFKVEVFAVWKAQNHHLLEATLHEQFDEFLINGEWFRFNKQQIDALVKSVPLKDLSTPRVSSFRNVERDAPEGQTVDIRYRIDISPEERESRKQTAISERLLRRANAPKCSACGRALPSLSIFKASLESQRPTS